MTLHFEGDDVREYIQMITLAEKHATQVETIKRIIERSQYSSDAVVMICNVLGIEEKSYDYKA